jgi:hypothetical protein
MPRTALRLYGVIERVTPTACRSGEGVPEFRHADITPYCAADITPYCAADITPRSAADMPRTALRLYGVIERVTPTACRSGEGVPEFRHADITPHCAADITPYCAADIPRTALRLYGVIERVTPTACRSGEGAGGGYFPALLTP